MQMIKNALVALRDEEDGQGMVEYGLILVLVSIASIALLSTMGGDIGRAFQDASTQLKKR